MPVIAEESRTDTRKPILYTVAALSMVAALIHLWVTPEHFEEWWGYGTFFIIAAVAQGAYGVALLRRPRQLLLLLGLGGNLSVVALYLVTRTMGVPLFGPEAAETGGLGVTGLCATVSELAIVLGLGAVLLRRLSPQTKRAALIVVAVALLSLAHLVHLLLRES